MAGSGLKLVYKRHFVNAFPAAVPSTSTTTWVSLKNYHHVTVLIEVVNTSGTITGSAITLNQATAVAGTASKALAFDTVYQDVDTAAADTLTATTVASNTFTTTTTASKNALYILEVDAATLDRDNQFDCFQVALATAANATVSVQYILGNERYAGATLPPFSAIVD